MERTSLFLVSRLNYKLGFYHVCVTTQRIPSHSAFSLTLVLSPPAHAPSLCSPRLKPLAYLTNNARRITDLEQIASRGDVQGFERMRYRVNNHGLANDVPSPTSNYGSSISPGPNFGNGTNTAAAAYGRPPLPNFGRPPTLPSTSALVYPSP